MFNNFKFNNNFLIFGLYLIVTIVIFWFRIDVITTHYGMPDVDTDAGLWQFTMGLYNYHSLLNLDFNTLIAYPFGFFYGNVAYYSILYDVMNIFIRLLGQNWQSTVLVTNIAALIVYPVSGYVTYRLSLYFIKNKYAAFISGLIFAFSYYHILYARNSQWINHVWMIPLFFITIINCIRQKTIRSLIISAIAGAVIFSANAYFFFYSMFFVPFLFLLEYKNFRNYLMNIIKFYFVSGILLILININFLVSQINIQFNSKNIELVGRSFISKGVVPPLSGVFSHAYNDTSNQRFIQHGVWLGYLPIILLFLGLLFVYKNKYLRIFTGAFIFAVLLGSYVPGLFWINEFILNIFPQFKSISRMLIYATLFLSLIVGIVIENFINLYWIKLLRKKQIIFLVLGFFLPVIHVYYNINSDTTRNHTTNMKTLVTIYEPIKNNKDIKYIAGYPRTIYSSNQDGGIPATYELLGQIIHGKTLVGGVDPFNQKGINFHRSIKNIMDPNTINNLRKYNIDTIIIYNKIINDPNYSQFPTDSDKIHKYLISNNDIVFLGRFSAPQDDINYFSKKDSSQDISIYQLTSVLESNKKRPESVLISTYNEILSLKLNSTKYSLNLAIPATSTGEELSFLQSYHKEWKLYPGRPIVTEDCTKMEYYSGSQYQLQGDTRSGSSTQSGINLTNSVITSGDSYILTHITTRGESLRSILKNYGYRVDQLYQYNSKLSLYPAIGEQLQVKIPRRLVLSGSVISQMVVVQGAGSMTRGPTTECIRDGYTFFQGEELSYLWKQPLWDDTHHMVYDYANGRDINLSQVTSDNSESYLSQGLRQGRITTNPDGSYNVALTLYFRPQSWFYLGLLISGSTFIGLISRLLRDRNRRKSI